MRSALLYVLAAVFLAAIVSLAWWTQQSEQPQSRVVRQGDTLIGLSEAYGVSPEELATINDTTIGELEIVPGTTIAVPVAPSSGLGVWYVHLAGMGAEILGVLLSFWLALIAGMAPSGFRKQILGISVVLGIASYASTWAVNDVAPVLVPRFVFGALKDGFAWSAAFPMFAAALGFGRAERSTGRTPSGRAAVAAPVQAAPTPNALRVSGPSPSGPSETEPPIDEQDRALDD